MGGLTYYASQPFLKRWQRIAIGFGLMITATAVGQYFDNLVEKRYSTFTGRTALYGDTTVRNGWLNSKKEEISK